MNETKQKEWEWELLVKMRGGRKFYHDKLSGKVSACDLSGKYPQHTDDGPLWIQTDRPILLRDQHDSFGQWASVAAIQERTGQECNITSDTREILWLIRNLGMTLKIQTPTVDDEMELNLQRLRMVGLEAEFKGVEVQISGR